MFDKKNPLWIPEGSIRALLALGLVISFLTFVGVNVAIPEQMFTIVGMIVAFYFGSRSQSSNN